MLRILGAVETESRGKRMEGGKWRGGLTLAVSKGNKEEVKSEMV